MDTPSSGLAEAFTRVNNDLTNGQRPDIFGYSIQPDVSPSERAALEQAIAADLSADSFHLKPIASRIRDFAKSSRASQVIASMLDAAKNADVKALAVMSSKLTEVLGNSEEGCEVFSASEAMAKGLETAMVESKQEEGIRTGWPSLDKCYRITPGSLLTLGAATNVGKSTVITSWLWGMAQRGTPVGLISVEDTTEDFGIKMLAAAAGLDPSSLWSMRLTPNDLMKVRAAIDTAKVPLSFSWVRTRRLQTVLDRMEHCVRVRGAKVVAVDFLQAIDGPKNKDKRAEIDHVLEALISQAGRLNVGLVVASQLNRSATSEDQDGNARTPGLSALKESGTIENRSQCVVLLHREKPTDQTIKVRLAKVKRHAAGAQFEVSRQGGNGLLYETTRHTENPWT